MPYRALIVFVSGGTAHEDAVAFHAGKGFKPILEHNWLIHSHYTEERAKEFQAQMDQRHHEHVRFYVGEHDEYCLERESQQIRGESGGRRPFDTTVLAGCFRKFQRQERLGHRLSYASRKRYSRRFDPNQLFEILQG